MARSSGRTQEVTSEPRSRPRRPTTTSSFGVSRRENHDASGFYDRFPGLKVSKDDRVERPAALDQIWTGDAREMDTYGDIADASVALVVTSPPYFAGKEYETAVGEGHVPDSYVTYLQMLHDVFAECRRKLEPGGRIAVNVANLGRKPFRSLASDVTDVLQRLGFLLRGEIIWIKGKAAGGSCAWGSFQRPGNPVFRDLSERVIVASKGRFDRARGARDRAAENLPSVTTISADEFMDLTTDVWELAPERATRVGHPAPFPVELPRRLIDLYTYEGDLVLDPFMGSGSTAMAALRTGRHFVGFDTDPGYVEQASARVEVERHRLAEEGGGERPVHVPAILPVGVDDDDDGAGDAQARAVRQGRKAKDLALLVLQDAGFTRIKKDVKLPAGVEVSFAGVDQTGNLWHFDVSGAFSASRPGLRRPDTLWRALGKASVLAAARVETRLVLLTTDVPVRGSAGDQALAAVRGQTVTDVVELRDEVALKRLRGYAEGLHP
jgi:site-specific DNA-methyltransferase (adenine-specific)